MSELGFGGRRELSNPEFGIESRRSRWRTPDNDASDHRGGFSADTSHSGSDTSLDDKSMREYWETRYNNTPNRLEGFSVATSPGEPDRPLLLDAAQDAEQNPDDFLGHHRSDLAELTPFQFAEFQAGSLTPSTNSEITYALQTIRPELRADFLFDPREARDVRFQVVAELENPLSEIRQYHKRFQLEPDSPNYFFVLRSDGGETRIQSTMGASGSWCHFHITGNQAENHGLQSLDTIPKLYVTIPNPEANFNVDTLRKALSVLVETGLNLQLKVPTSSGQVKYCFDNIVIHASTTEDVLTAHARLQEALGAISPTFTFGADVDNTSFSQSLAESVDRAQRSGGGEFVPNGRLMHALGRFK